MSLEPSFEIYVARDVLQKTNKIIFAKLRLDMNLKNGSPSRLSLQPNCIFSQIRSNFALSNVNTMFELSWMKD